MTSEVVTIRDKWCSPMCMFFEKVWHKRFECLLTGVILEADRVNGLTRRIPTCRADVMSIQQRDCG